MSRSQKKTPISGITTAASDKAFKVAEHRRERRASKTDLGEGHEPPHPKAFGNPWNSEKDGKACIADPRPEDMRK